MKNKHCIFLLLTLVNYFVFTANAADLHNNSMALVVMQYPDNKDYPFGHAALRVRGGDYDYLYELCVLGPLSRGVGQGVLKWWQIANKGIEKRINDGAIAKFYEINSTKEQNELARRLFLTMAATQGVVDEDVITYEPNSLYDFLNNNCVTVAITLFEKSTNVKLHVNNNNKKIYLSKGAYVGLSVFSEIGFYKWPHHTCIPRELADLLENDSRFTPSTSDNATVVDMN